jgi:hypothetical protein
MSWSHVIVGNGPLDPQPVLLKEKLVGEVVETQGKVAVFVGAGCVRQVGPAGDSEAVAV